MKYNNILFSNNNRIKCDSFRYHTQQYIKKKNNNKRLKEKKKITSVDEKKTFFKQQQLIETALYDPY